VKNNVTLFIWNFLPSDVDQMGKNRIIMIIRSLCYFKTRGEKRATIRAIREDRVGPIKM